MINGKSAANVDPETVRGFGEEWERFDQSNLSEAEHRELFGQYFSIFPFAGLPPDAEGFDLGCGSGRWALLMAEKVGRLHCVDPSEKALQVARRKLARCANADFHLAAADSMPFADGSQDFGYSLGVLHHIPDTEGALACCVRKLKTGAPFLLYLYYNFDNRPMWFRLIWMGSNTLRKGISRLPFRLRVLTTSLIAGAVYFPLARLAALLHRLGINVESLPLSAYRSRSFYTMRTDALDRFGTRLEQRFSRDEIEQMMRRSGLNDIVFRPDAPFWVACGYKTAPGDIALSTAAIEMKDQGRKTPLAVKR